MFYRVDKHVACSSVICSLHLLLTQHLLLRHNINTITIIALLVVVLSSSISTAAFALRG